MIWNGLARYFRKGYIKAPTEYLLLTGDASYKVGQYAPNDGALTYCPLGIYQVTKVEWWDTHYKTYGVLVIPCNLSSCIVYRITDDLNKPIQCEHWWHAGPERKFWGIKYEPPR